MKIRPLTAGEAHSEHVPAELGPAWWVSEGDRRVSHVITLAEVLGLHEPDEDDQHRRVARNHLRNRLLATLADGFPADAIHDGVGEERYLPFARNARVAAASFRQLCDRASDGWAPGLSPVELGLNNVILAARDFKQRHGRTETARWWQVIITELEKLLAISESRLHD